MLHAAHTPLRAALQDRCPVACRGVIICGSRAQGENSMWKKAKWIGISAEQIRTEQIYAGDMNGRFAYFRKVVFCQEQPGNCEIDITANTRYRLWINGEPVLSGPCKGDWNSHYYETVDVTKYLRLGENVFAVQVLFLNPYDVDGQYGNERTPILAAVSSPAGHRLALEGKILDKNGERLAGLTTGETDWQVYLDGAYYIKCKEINCNSGGFCEDVDFRREPVEWKEPGFVCQTTGKAVKGGEEPETRSCNAKAQKEKADDKCEGETEGVSAGRWWTAAVFETVLPGEFNRKVGFTGKFQVKKRPIPLLFEDEGILTRELGTKVFGGSGSEAETFEGSALEEIIVAPGEKVRILFCRERVTNAYMRYSFSGGRGGRAVFTYFEKFVKDGEDIPRDDYRNGRVEGMQDEIVLSGGPLIFEPFWVRTFRFLEIRLEAGKEPIRFSRPRFRRTGYPLERKSCIRSREFWVEELWEMCVATLQNCMLETYMDCPFYEQMQFLMDTRLQALFHYAVDGDVRLAKKALWDFHCSMTPEGLMHGKYPSSFPQIISTFSLHFVFMLKDFYWQTGDVEEIKRYRSDVDAILEYYDRQIGDSGLVERVGYWPFVDWQQAWADCAGVPAAAAEGASTIHNLMYAYALGCAAELSEATGREGMRQEYLERQEHICRRVRELCWDSERGLYREGPDFVQYTQHAQSWAALNGMGTDKERRRMLLHALEEPDVMPCSFATSYELFRALEQAGLYRETKGLMDRWIALGEKHCTTCPEEPDRGRSENHAWSALPMYEMMRKLAGIEPGEPGWGTVAVRPHLEYVTSLRGQAATPRGTVEFSYEPAQDGTDNICCRVTLPRGRNGIFFLPDGSSRELTEGENQILIVG